MKKILYIAILTTFSLWAPVSYAQQEEGRSRDRGSVLEYILPILPTTTSTSPSSTPTSTSSEELAPEPPATTSSQNDVPPTSSIPTPTPTTTEPLPLYLEATTTPLALGNVSSTPNFGAGSVYGTHGLPPELTRMLLGLALAMGVGGMFLAEQQLLRRLLRLPASRYAKPAPFA